MTNHDKAMNWFYREQKRLKCIVQLNAMDELSFTETDTIISNLSTVSKDCNLSEFMHKIGGAYTQ